MSTPGHLGRQGPVRVEVGRAVLDDPLPVVLLLLEVGDGLPPLLDEGGLHGLLVAVLDLDGVGVVFGHGLVAPARRDRD
jgi:hypothetical protein